MKKILIILMVFVSTLFFTGCGQKNIEGKLDDLMDNVYKDIKEDDLPMMIEQIKLNDENIANFVGTKEIDYKEALASESGIGSYAHSVVLLRAKDDADIEKMKETIKKEINPRKWVCVGVERDEVVVENRGNLIIVIIESDEKLRKTLLDRFNKL